MIGSDFSVKSDSIVFQEERERGGGVTQRLRFRWRKVWAENKVEKGIFFNEIKGGTERTGVQRFVTRYVEINAVKDNFNFFYWMPFSNIKMVHLMPHFPF